MHKKENCFLTAIGYNFSALFTVRRLRFTLYVYEITYKLHETKKALQLEKLLRSYCNTITGNGANAFSN